MVARDPLRHTHNFVNKACSDTRLLVSLFAAIPKKTPKQPCQRISCKTLIIKMHSVYFSFDYISAAGGVHSDGCHWLSFHETGTVHAGVVSMAAE